MKTNIITLCLSIACITSIASVYHHKITTSILTSENIIHGIMNFPMSHITKRCQKDFGYTDDDMILLEQELKRYLILCSLKENVATNINMYSTDVDNLWHSFILFTKEYAHFCNTHAQRFIHHTPRINDSFTQEEILEARQNLRSFVEIYEKTFKEEINPIWLIDRCS